MKFFSIASCSDGNSYAFFDSKDHIILIDAGISMRKLNRTFTELGLNVSDIKHIIITHSHNDHTKGLLSLYSKLSPVIHVNAANDYHFRRYGSLLSTYMFMEPINILKFSILPVNVTHDALNAALLITYGEKRVGFISDAGHLTDEHLSLFKDLDMLAIESNHSEDTLSKTKYPEHLKRRISSKYGHLSNKQAQDAVKEMASERLKNVLFIHMSKRSNSPEILNNESMESLKSEFPSVKFSLAPYDTPSEIIEI